jgi:hypothetical protein
MSMKHGSLVGWERFRNPKIHRSLVEQSLAKHGLPTEVVHDLTPKAAFGRACQEMKENRQIDKLKHKGGVFQFQLTKKALLDERIEFDFEAIVELDGASGRITCNDLGIRQRAEVLFNDALAHRTPQDITKMVLKLLTTGCECWPFLVEKGCVYFVPDKHDDMLNKVEKFVTDMGGTFRRSPVPRGDGYGDQTAKEACMAYLHGMLKELREVVDGFDETTRSDTMLRVAERFQELKFKAESYKEYTSHTIETAIEEARKGLIQKVKDVEEAKKDEAQKMAQVS